MLAASDHQPVSSAPRYALIIGAGPAGLTAAFELLTRTDVIPIVLEKSDMIGGISRTVNYKGNRIDIGGHRFFSKSDRVMAWWQEILPVEASAEAGRVVTYQRKSRVLPASPNGPAADADSVMLVRNRKSRIYFMRQFFEYPIRLDPDTLRKLGPRKTARIGVSYVRRAAFPLREEQNLEQFFINRFGRELYETFFKAYTEKVWGVPCTEISAEWGAQRIKGLSVGKAVTSFLRKLAPRAASEALNPSDTETSLIERFLYPKYGPGQMWEEAARRVVAMGGTIRMEQEVVAVHTDGLRMTGLTVRNTATGAQDRIDGDYVFSTMPVKELVGKIVGAVPAAVREVSDGLEYRDFLTVGLLLEELKIKEAHPNGSDLIRDNWIYIQEPDVSVGRLQIFNNWSPFLVADPTKVWIGMEYFCYESDALWQMDDERLKTFAIDELARIGIIDAAKVNDACVIRMAKAYPAYFGSYTRFDVIRSFLDGYANLFLIGRNGMHKYNNQDHSMLTAMAAVDAIAAGSSEKSAIWDVNAEDDYHETVKK